MPHIILQTIRRRLAWIIAGRVIAMLGALVAGLVTILFS